MKNKIWMAGIVVLACTGCNVGNAPEPMNDNDLKSAIEKLPPQDQINYIKSSPMPPEMKAQKIKEIEEKTGYKSPERDPSKSGPAGVPGTAP